MVLSGRHCVALAVAPSPGIMAEESALSNIYLLLAAMFLLAGTAFFRVASHL